MQTEIYYRDLTRTEALENYLIESVENEFLDFFKNDESARLTIRAETIRHRSQSRKPMYALEIVLKPSHTKAVMKVVKQDNDFYLAVQKATGAMKQMLRKRSDRFHNHHRKEYLKAA